MPEAGTILVVDDRLKSAASLVAWLGDGPRVTVSTTYAEAADTIAYLHLAGSPLPTLVIGPLAKDGVAFLADLRGQGIEIPTAFYTETRSRDQDAAIARQYALVAILHKPFADEDRSRLLSRPDAPEPRASFMDERPGVADAAPLRAEETPSPPAARHRDPLDDLIGGNRVSSVKEGMPPQSRPSVRADELPSGVQRLLVDPMAGATPPTVQQQADRKPVEARSISMLAIDDGVGNARILAERLGAPGQSCKAVASYADSFPQLERLMMGTMGCELLFGPLSAEGVAAIRDYRKRGWQTHVVFFTESATQSQDARLAAQYGCLAIVRRSGMVDQLERLVAEIRGKPRQAAAVPLDAAAAKTAPAKVRTPPPSAPQTSVVRAAPLPASDPPAKPVVTSGTWRMPAGAPAGTGTADPRAPGSLTRVRRSIGSAPPAPAAPAAPSGSNPPPLRIDVPGEVPSGHERVIACVRCKREFIASFTSLPAKVLCGNCGAPNALK